MTRKQTPLTLALGSAIAAAMAVAPAAADSVFSAQALTGGYMVAEAGKPADKAQEGKCAGQAKAKEGNCGAGAKAQEGKCAANKK